jgi:hypothetical protein
MAGLPAEVGDLIPVTVKEEVPGIQTAAFLNFLISERGLYSLRQGWGGVLAPGPAYQKELLPSNMRLRL